VKYDFRGQKAIKFEPTLWGVLSLLMMCAHRHALSYTRTQHSSMHTQVCVPARTHKCVCVCV